MFLKVIILCIFSSVLATTTYSSQLEEMHLLGKGEVYYLNFIKVYDASLYTQEPLGTNNILGSTISKCLLLEYDVSLKSKDFVKAANTVLQRQYTAGQLENVQDELDQLHNNYIDVKEGDSYTLCYDKSIATLLLSLHRLKIESNATILSLVLSEKKVR
jgi:hypothetical protein